MDYKYHQQNYVSHSDRYLIGLNVHRLGLNVHPCFNPVLVVIYSGVLLYYRSF